MTAQQGAVACRALRHECWLICVCSLRIRRRRSKNRHGRIVTEALGSAGRQRVEIRPGVTFWGNGSANACNSPGPSPKGRVEEWRGGFRLDLSVSAPFVWRCLSSQAVTSVSTPPSSNRAGGFPAPGSRTKHHAFAHGSSRPSAVRRTSPKCP